jgi:cyclophilin family peptidyl-prolyl cis-trans isomerase
MEEMIMKCSEILFAIVFCAVVFSFTGMFPRVSEATDDQARPVALFETSMGNFKIELYNDLAPKTCRSFMDLAERNFYDGIIFHRVIKDFMIQGGDPTGTGTGGPGYTIPDEFGPGLAHDSEGILSMANAGPNTGGSQFFITLVPTEWLNGKHAIFGHVTEGIEVVRAIGEVRTGRGDKPVTDVVINKLTIEGDTEGK